MTPHGWWVGMIATAALFFSATAAQPQQDPLIIFAVVTKVSKDKKQVTAQVSDGGPSVEAALIPTDPILDNLIWRKLEICHALKAEAWKNQEGYRLVSIRVLDAGMLPMPLQGVAGDCLIKKALDFGPLVD